MKFRKHNSVAPATGLDALPPTQRDKDQSDIVSSDPPGPFQSGVDPVNDDATHATTENMLLPGAIVDESESDNLPPVVPRGPLAPLRLSYNSTNTPANSEPLAEPRRHTNAVVAFGECDEAQQVKVKRPDAVKQAWGGRRLTMTMDETVQLLEAEEGRKNDVSNVVNNHGVTFALLNRLTCSMGLLEPSFDPTVLLYTLSLPPAASHVTFHPASSDGQCLVNGNERTSDAILTADPVQRVVIHVVNECSTTPYQISMVKLSEKTYQQLASPENAPVQCLPVSGPPSEPPPIRPDADGAGPVDESLWYTSVMEYSPQEEEQHTIALSAGDQIVVGKWSASEWWPAANSEGKLGWVPAACLRPKITLSDMDSRIETPLQPDDLLQLVNLSKGASTNVDTVEYISTLRAMNKLTEKDLDQIENGIRNELASPASSRHKRLHLPKRFPQFSILLAVVQVLSFIICIAVHGTVPLDVNPVGGLGWSGFRRAGACWPPDVHDGHIYTLVTALIVPVGAFRTVFDVAVLLFFIRHAEKIYGFRRICLSFIACGVAGNCCGMLFNPRYITTGPGPGLIGLLTWMLTEVPKDQVKDATFLLGAISISFIFGGFPGNGIWSLLGGGVFGMIARLINTLPVGSYSNVQTTRRFGIGFGIIVFLTLVIGLAVTGKVDPTCETLDSNKIWCPGCEDVYYDAYNWCSPNQFDRC